MCLSNDVRYFFSDEAVLILYVRCHPRVVTSNSTCAPTSAIFFPLTVVIEDNKIFYNFYNNDCVKADSVSVQGVLFPFSSSH